MTQVSNGVQYRVTAVDIFLAYASACSLLFLQLRYGVIKRLLVGRKLREQSCLEKWLDNVGLSGFSGFDEGCKGRLAEMDFEESFGDRGASVMEGVRLIVLGAVLALISGAEVLLVWFVHYIEYKAFVWTVSLSVYERRRRDGGGLANHPRGVLAVDGYVTTARIKATTIFHSDDAVKQLLAGATIVTVIAVLATGIEIFSAYSEFSVKEYRDNYVEHLL